MSRNHEQIKWANRSRAERAKLAPLLPLPCGRCGREVDATMRWVVGHVDDLATTGYDTGHRQPEHASCSARSGGRLAAAMVRREQDIRPW